jgi:hypothetical protein
MRNILENTSQKSENARYNTFSPMLSPEKAYFYREKAYFFEEEKSRVSH